jgi:hypothetical protein
LSNDENLAEGEIPVKWSCYAKYDIIYDMENIPTKGLEFDLEEFKVKQGTEYDNLIREVDSSSRMKEGVRAGSYELVETDHVSSSINALFGSSNYVDEILGLSIKKPELSMEEEQGLEKSRAFLKERLSGKILIDLGGGRNRSIEALAQNFGVAVYIKVDVYYQSSLADEHGRLADNGKLQDGEMVVYNIKSDMLQFLSTLPNDSVCIAINGIDMAVIPSEEYHEALVKEIVRVLIPNGIVFGRVSESLKIMQDRLLSGQLEIIPGQSIKPLDFPGLRLLTMFEKSN